MCMHGNLATSHLRPECTPFSLSGIERRKRTPIVWYHSIQLIQFSFGPVLNGQEQDEMQAAPLPAEKHAHSPFKQTGVGG